MSLATHVLLAAVETKVSISPTTRVFALCLAAAFLILILELVRRRMLRERYIVVWFVAGLTLMALAIVPRALETLASLAGIQDPTAALFAFALAVAGLLLLNLTSVVSRQGDHITALAQEVALLRAKVESDEGDET